MKFTEQQQREAADSFINWMCNFLRCNDLTAEVLESTIDFDFAGHSAFIDASFYKEGEIYFDSLDYLNEDGDPVRVYAVEIPYFIAHLHENMMNKVLPVSGFNSLDFQHFLSFGNNATFKTNPKALKDVKA